MGEVKKAPHPKMYHTYPTLMKLGTVIPCLKKIQNYLNHVTHPLNSAEIGFLHRKSATFGVSRNTDI